MAEYKYISCTHTVWLKLAHLVKSLVVMCAEWVEQTYWQIQVRSCNIFTPSLRALVCQCRTIKEMWGVSTQTQCSANPLWQSLKLFLLSQTSSHMNLVSHKTCRFSKQVTSFVVANLLFSTDSKVSKTTAACLISVMNSNKICWVSDIYKWWIHETLYYIIKGVNSELPLTYFWQAKTDSMTSIRLDSYMYLEGLTKTLKKWMITNYTSCIEFTVIELTNLFILEPTVTEFSINNWVEAENVKHL